VPHTFNDTDTFANWSVAGHVGETNLWSGRTWYRKSFETELSKIAATDLPWNSPHWHPAHGGIYRSVYLHVTDPLHISLPLYSYCWR
jgi:hypothetical protein